MPRRAAAGNRPAIERELSVDQLAELRRACADMQIPADRWQAVPWLQMYFETQAASNLARRIRAEGRLGAKSALMDAAERLGLPGDTIRSRIERAQRDAIRSLSVLTPARER
jgi:hypothetical protein